MYPDSFLHFCIVDLLQCVEKLYNYIWIYFCKRLRLLDVLWAAEFSLLMYAGGCSLSKAAWHYPFESCRFKLDVTLYFAIWQRGGEGLLKPVWRLPSDTVCVPSVYLYWYNKLFYSSFSSVYFITEKLVYSHSGHVWVIEPHSNLLLSIRFPDFMNWKAPKKYMFPAQHCPTWSIR